MAGKRGKGEGTTLVVRREEVVEGGHHGGAWKVAYADFVTAMMAFFLLMWLLNATTEEQRRGIADYFSPMNIMAHHDSGAGKPFGGKTPYEDGPAISSHGTINVAKQKEVSTDIEDNAEIPMPQQPSEAGDRNGDGYRDQAASGAVQNGAAQPGRAATGQAAAGAVAAGEASPGTAAPGDRQPGAAADGSAQANAAQANSAQAGSAPADAAPMPLTAKAEEKLFQTAASQIRDAIRNDPALAVLAPQLAVDETPEGLRIQLLDADRKAMFAFGSSVPNDRARLLLAKVAPILARLPEKVAVTGHTDAAPFRSTDRTNWELSAERANATRRTLIDSGLADTRFRSVAGDADRDLLLPGDPLAAANRRIAIVVLRHAT